MACSARLMQSRHAGCWPGQAQAGPSLLWPPPKARPLGGITLLARRCVLQHVC